MPTSFLDFVDQEEQQGRLAAQPKSFMEFADQELGQNIPAAAPSLPVQPVQAATATMTPPTPQSALARPQRGLAGRNRPGTSKAWKPGLGEAIESGASSLLALPGKAARAVLATGNIDYPLWGADHPDVALAREATARAQQFVTEHDPLGKFAAEQAAQAETARKDMPQLEQGVSKFLEAGTALATEWWPIFGPAGKIVGTVAAPIVRSIKAIKNPALRYAAKAAAQTGKTAAMLGLASTALEPEHPIEAGVSGAKTGLALGATGVVSSPIARAFESPLAQRAVRGVFEGTTGGTLAALGGENAAGIGAQAALFSGFGLMHPAEAPWRRSPPIEARPSPLFETPEVQPVKSQAVAPPVSALATPPLVEPVREAIPQPPPIAPVTVAPAPIQPLKSKIMAPAPVAPPEPAPRAPVQPVGPITIRFKTEAEAEDWYRRNSRGAVIENYDIAEDGSTEITYTPQAVALAPVKKRNRVLPTVKAQAAPVEAIPGPLPEPSPPLTAAERLTMKKWVGTVYRGTSEAGPDDPGDLGIGEYHTTQESYAKQYGKVTSKEVTLENPIRINLEEAHNLIEEYGTLRGNLNERKVAATRLTRDLQEQGYDGLVINGYETNGETVIVFPKQLKPIAERLTPEELKAMGAEAPPAEVSPPAPPEKLKVPEAEAPKYQLDAKGKPIEILGMKLRIRSQAGQSLIDQKVESMELAKLKNVLTPNQLQELVLQPPEIRKDFLSYGYLITRGNFRSYMRNAEIRYRNQVPAEVSPPAPASPEPVPSRPPLAPTQAAAGTALGNAVFIRKLKVAEQRSPSHYLANIPAKEGYTAVYKPYGNTGDRADRGYYYAPNTPAPAEAPAPAPTIKPDLTVAPAEAPGPKQREQKIALQLDSDIKAHELMLKTGTYSNGEKLPVDELRVIRKAIVSYKQLYRELLERSAGEPWADAALAKLEAPPIAQPSGLLAAGARQEGKAAPTTKLEAKGNQYFPQSVIKNPVYHGTSAEEFDNFRPPYELNDEAYKRERITDKGLLQANERDRETGPLFYFSESENTAKSYADASGEGSGRVIEVSLDVKNPFYAESREDAVAALRSGKYDGAQFDDTTNEGRPGGKAWVVRRTDQIKKLEAKGGEENVSVGEREIAESDLPEHPGIGEGRTPEGPSNRNFIERSRQVEETKITSLMPAFPVSVNTVDSSVLALAQHPKIFKSIVRFIPVDVMNLLAGKKGSAQRLFNNPTMFKEALSINTDMNIFSRVMSSLGEGIARLRTELLGSDSTRWNEKISTASKAGNLNPGEIVWLSSFDRAEPGKFDLGRPTQPVTPPGTKLASGGAKHFALTNEKDIPTNLARSGDIPGSTFENISATPGTESGTVISGVNQESLITGLADSIYHKKTISNEELKVNKKEAGRGYRPGQGEGVQEQGQEVGPQAGGGAKPPELLTIEAKDRIANSILKKNPQEAISVARSKGLLSAKTEELIEKARYSDDPEGEGLSEAVWDSLDSDVHKWLAQDNPYMNKGPRDIIKAAKAGNPQAIDALRRLEMKPVTPESQTSVDPPAVAEAKKRISRKARGEQPQAGPLDLETFRDLVTIGKHYYGRLAEGARNFAEWSKVMLREVGSWIDQRLGDIFDRVTRKGPRFLPSTGRLGAVSGGGKERGSKAERAKAEEEAAMAAFRAMAKRKGIGRPELANPAIEPQARKLVDVVDEERKQAGIPEVRKDEIVFKEADDRLVADPQGERQRLIDKGAVGSMLTDTETIIAKRIIQEDALQAVQSDNPDAWVNASILTDSYRRTGTPIGRSFRQRRDPVMGPLERAQQFISEAILIPDKKAEKAIDKARTPQERKQAYVDWTKRAQKIKESLKTEGVDIDKMTAEDMKDPRITSSIIRAISAKRATLGDKIYEYWQNSILSGLLTHVVNTTGNLTNAITEYGLYTPLTAAINSAVGSKAGLRLGDLPYLYKAMWPGILRAAHNSRMAFATEMEQLGTQVRGEDPFNYRRTDTRGPAIGGKTGRIVRAIGYRPLRAMDEAAKSLIGEMQTNAEAHRIATKEGLSGNALTERMNELTEDLEGPAWQAAYDKAEYLAFQSHLGRASSLLAMRRNLIMKWFVPFVTTPINIFRAGVRHTLLGTPIAAYRRWLKPSGNLEASAARIAGSERITDPEKLKIRTEEVRQELRNADTVHRIAEQLVALGTTYAIASAIMGQKDDDEPRITGSKPMKFRANRGAGDIIYRTAPPFSIRVEDKYYSYSKIEPIATSLAITVDTLNGIRDLKEGQDASARLDDFVAGMKEMVRDKTFFYGITQIVDLVDSGRKNVLSNLLARQIVSFVPNLARQTAAATDPMIRERRVFGTSSAKQQGESFMSKLQSRTSYLALPTAGRAPESTVDIYGRDVKKPMESFVGRLLSPVVRYDPDKQPEEVRKIDQALIRYNRENPNEPYYPDIPDPYLRIDKKTYYLSDKQYHDFLKTSGEGILRILTARMMDGRLKLDGEIGETQIKQIKRVIDNTREIERNKLKLTLTGGSVLDSTTPQRRRVLPRIPTIRRASKR